MQALSIIKAYFNCTLEPYFKYTSTVPQRYSASVQLKRLEPPTAFEPGTPGLEIQDPNHYAILQTYFCNLTTEVYFKYASKDILRFFY